MRDETHKCDWCGKRIKDQVIGGAVTYRTDEFCSYKCMDDSNDAWANYLQALEEWQQGRDRWIQAYHRESPKPLPPLAPYERPKSGSDPSSQPCP